MEIDNLKLSLGKARNDHPSKLLLIQKAIYKNMVFKNNQTCPKGHLMKILYCKPTEYYSVRLCDTCGIHINYA